MNMDEHAQELEPDNCPECGGKMVTIEGCPHCGMDEYTRVSVYRFQIPSFTLMMKINDDFVVEDLRQAESFFEGVMSRLRHQWYEKEHPATEEEELKN
jgi:predicted  nucleic acid-binding Zn-ribbon protein